MDAPRLDMQLRAVDVTQRTIAGVVAPYDETTYLVPDPAGERICRGAFAKSITQRGTRIPLFVGHTRKSEAAVGLSQAWTDDDAGLSGVFAIKPGPEGDQALADADGGYFGGMSVEFAPVNRGRGDDGAVEVREAKLLGVALVGVSAYAGARILAVRSAQAVLEKIGPRPAIDLSPIPAVWLYDRAR